MSRSISHQHAQEVGPLQAHRCGRARWHVCDGWHDVLLGPHGLRLEEWLAAGLAQEVKRGANRTMYRVALPDYPAFFVKHYQPRGWHDAARAVARGSLARYEWKKVAEVLRRGIPTTVPLAWGETRGAWGDSYLVTRAIEPAATLGVWLASLSSRPAGEAARLRRELLEELVALVSACHAAGVRQPDLHAGNLLVQLPTDVDPRCENGQSRHTECACYSGGSRGRVSPRLAFASRRDAATCSDRSRHTERAYYFDRPSRPRVYLIDVPAVRFSAPLGWAESCQNLGVLCGALSHVSTLGERYRFCCGYLAARPSLDVSQRREAAAQIARQALASAQRVVRNRDRRCWRDNADYQWLDTPHGRIYGARDLPAEQLAALAHDPEGPLRANRHRVVKISHASVVVAAELPATAGALAVAYKRSRQKSWWKGSLAWLRRPRVLAGWQLAHSLTLRGIATARPVAAYQSRRGDGYLATEWLAGAENLHLYGWRLAKLPAGERSARARRCLQRLGELIGNLHAWDVSHRDLKGVNLAAVDRRDGSGEVADVAIYLLDLDGVRLRRRLSYATRVRNLARLAVSLDLQPWIARTLLLRFLRAYLRTCGEPQLSWKPLWRDVARVSSRIAAQRRRRGRKAA